MSNVKFKFTTEFQFDLLRFTVLDRDGYKALELYNDSYFTLTEHAVIANTLKRFYKLKKRVPGKVIFKEELLKTFDKREFTNNLTDDDRKEILRITDNIFTGIVQDGDEILEETERFAQFIELKDVVESIDLLDFETYEPFSRKVQTAISSKLKNIDERGNFLVKDIRHRQFKRQDSSPIVSLPFKQLNNLTNAGGSVKGSIHVVLDKAKKFKTGILVNIAERYLRRKNVLVVDLDNGEDDWMQRLEQSISNRTKKDILSGDSDKEVQRSLRKRKRLGSELVHKRFPALITTANDIDTYMDYLYREYGLRFHIIIIDYISKMGAISGKESLHERISEAYIDIGNLALKHKIEHVWTAQHVTRQAAEKREGKRYDATDVAGSIDITRHVQVIYGLNRTPDEEEAGIMRMEIVDQRDGVPSGRAIFKVDYQRQRVKEATKDEIALYYETYGANLSEIEDEDENKYKPKNDLDGPQ